jgi:hypothetical protein
VYSSHAIRYIISADNIFNIYVCKPVYISELHHEMVLRVCSLVDFHKYYRAGRMTFQKTSKNGPEQLE